MAKPGPQSKQPDGKVADAAPTQDLAPAPRSKERDLSLLKLNQMISILWLPSGASGEIELRTVNAALASLEKLAPRDESEGMLASQMVATHHAAMECLRRAMIPNQTFEGREQNLKHATKLLGV